MDRKFKGLLPYIVIILLAAAVAGMLMYIVPYRSILTKDVSFEMSDKPPLDNPLIGYAPPAQNIRECQRNNLVFIRLTWNMWEPEEGVYDIDAFEKEFNIAEWKSQNKHAVLRFICDLPGDEEHMDIPLWLYEKTKDGRFYSSSYGKGYSPDYSNEFFMERHRKAISALAEYCNSDSFVAYVELGSLGHWGEWHIDNKAMIPLMPDAELCAQYVKDYADHFTNAKMLMRRNYAPGVENGFGIYNDMMGVQESTELWLDWINNGGSYSTQGEPLEFTPTECFWEMGPAGGELTSRYSMEDLLGKQFSTTLSTIEQSHATFIGPCCPTKELADSDASKTILSSLGYRYYISRLKTGYSFRKKQLSVDLTWKSVGAAPIYWDWNAKLYIYDVDGTLLSSVPLDLQLSKLMPGEETEVGATIPFSKEILDGYKIGISVTSPDGKEHIRLAMDSTEEIGGVQIIFENQAD